MVVKILLVCALVCTLAVDMGAAFHTGQGRGRGIVARAPFRAKRDFGQMSQMLSSLAGMHRSASGGAAGDEDEEDPPPKRRKKKKGGKKAKGKKPAKRPKGGAKAQPAQAAQGNQQSEGDDDDSANYNVGAGGIGGKNTGGSGVNAMNGGKLINGDSTNTKIKAHTVNKATHNTVHFRPVNIRYEKAYIGDHSGKKKKKKKKNKKKKKKKKPASEEDDEDQVDK